MNNLIINFAKQDGLVPAIIQDCKSGQVLMLGYMNGNALQKTIKNNMVYFWSRSRKKLWMKGETSGNKLILKSIFTDCDKDAILIKVELLGNCVCHTGEKTCFFKNLLEEL